MTDYGDVGRASRLHCRVPGGNLRRRWRRDLLLCGPALSERHAQFLQKMLTWPPGSYLLVPVLSLYSACYPGSYSEDAASECLPCPASSTSLLNAATCTCNAGFKSTGTGTSLVCTGTGAILANQLPPCFGNNVRAPKLSIHQSPSPACPQGWFSQAGDADCTQCPVGSTTPGEGSTTCLCLPGYAISTVNGTLNCIACTAGTYSPSGAPCIRTCCNFRVAITVDRQQRPDRSRRATGEGSWQAQRARPTPTAVTRPRHAQRAPTTVPAQRAKLLAPAWPVTSRRAPAPR